LLPYQYEKTVWLDGDALALDYAITNIGDKPFPMLWTMHGLMRVEPNMRLFFPEGVETVLNLSASRFLGPKGDLPYPTCTAPDGQTVHLDRPLPYGEPCAWKIYIKGRVSKGLCGAVYPTQGVRLHITYDEQKLPYLGLWMTQRGFRGDTNFALEPTNGFYDGISLARGNGALPELDPGQTFQFSIRVSLEAVDHAP
jgi:galactose mutarotase-like enzyme